MSPAFAEPFEDADAGSAYRFRTGTRDIPEAAPSIFDGCPSHQAAAQDRQGTQPEKLPICLQLSKEGLAVNQARAARTNLGHQRPRRLVLFRFPMRTHSVFSFEVALRYFGVSAVSRQVDQNSSFRMPLTRLVVRLTDVLGPYLAHGFVRGTKEKS